jgi:ribonuclease BN (tRNA processing enzyme)
VRGRQGWTGQRHVFTIAATRAVILPPANPGGVVPKFSRALALALLATAMPLAARAAQGPANEFITLGTMGGPIASATRSQPANLLVQGDAAYLIDSGDGTVGQLTKAGFRLQQVKAVFLSHLHIDHTGGLAAVMGLRYQSNVPGQLAIYGPPGTKQLVAGIVASLHPFMEAGYGLPGTKRADPAGMFTVTEIDDGSKVALGDLVVTAAQNSHYSFVPGSDEDRRFRSLALRFDLPGRSIAYTGDTGPSKKVEQLARGADILFSEMIDLEATLANERRANPDRPQAERDELRLHLVTQHLTPDEVGKLAARAQVKRLVVTHYVAGSTGEAEKAQYLATIKKEYTGPAQVANDLERF